MSYIGTMKKFNHIDAKTVDEAVSALGKGKAVVIAGGTDLLARLKDVVMPGDQYPATLVNIKTIPGMDYIKEDAEGLKIGALARLADIANNATVKAKYTVLALAAGMGASPQIREMATIGGSLCQPTRCWYYRVPNNRFPCYYKGGTVCPAAAATADNRYLSIFGPTATPCTCISDTATALTALDAKIKTSTRTIAIKDLYVTLGTTLKPDEIVTEIQVPTPPTGAKQTYLKFRLRKAMDYAIVSVASVITVTGGTCTDAKIALGAVAPTPIRATAAENAIKGKAIDATTAEAAGTAAVTGAIPLSMNAYKIQITKVLVKRAILA